MIFALNMYILSFFFRFPGSWCSTCWQVQPHEGEQGIVSAINDDDHLPINRGNYTIY